MAVGLAAASLGVLLLLLRIGQGRSDGCTTDCSSSTEFQKEGIEYVLPQSGYQAILPGMEFTCYGYIINWTALVVVDDRFKTLTHQIYFQLWRPVVSGSERMYRRVDDDNLEFFDVEMNIDMTTTLPDENIRFLRFEAKRGKTDSRMYFKPGDIVGFFIPPRISASIVPLGITFRNASHMTPPDAAVDMYSYSTRQQLCELSECGQDVAVHRSILPQISVNYEEVSPSATTPPPMANSCSSAVIEPCSSPTSHSTTSTTMSHSTTSNTPTDSTTLTTTDMESSGSSIPRIAWIIGGVLVLLLIISIIVIVTLAMVVAFHRGKTAERHRNRNSSSNSSSLGIVTPYASANLLGYASSEASVKRTDNAPYAVVEEMRYTPLMASNFGNGTYRGSADTNSDIYSRRTSESQLVTAETNAYGATADSRRESYVTGSSPPSVVSETGPYRGVATGSRSNETYESAVDNGIHRGAIETRNEVYISRNNPYHSGIDTRNETHHVTSLPGTSAMRSNSHRQFPDQRNANPLENIQEIPWYMGGKDSYFEEEV